jgi:hypothetical protein
LIFIKKVWLLDRRQAMAQQQRTSIGIKMATKDKLDKHRAPGQCYDGFICQLLDLWEKNKKTRATYLAGPAGGS